MLHLGSIGGTTIRVDFSFLLLIALFVAMSYNPGRGIEYALIWAPVLFISVLVHELAHAATIALFGYGSSQIVLGGLGGVTINARQARPWHDVMISIAGPLSSFALAFLFASIQFHPAVLGDKMFIVLVPTLARVNFLWGILNLLPVAPLDGGQAVRNFLRMLLEERTAFVIAVWVSIVAGVAAAIYGLVTQSNYLAILMASFVNTN
jgi:Zn-dependent protease